MRERRLVQPAEPSIGDLVAECVGARLDTSKAGNPMVVWEFRLDDGRRVNRYTVKRRLETAQVAEALGLGRRFRLSEAAGRRCILSVTWDGMYHSIESCRPIEAGGPL